VSTDRGLVRFWAEWCVPCHAMAPVVERIAHDHRLQLVHVDVDIDTGQALAAELGVQSVPTVVRFEGGRETHRAVGPMPRARLARQLGLSDRQASSSDHGSEVSNGIG
jgi:thioredoxin 1